MIYQKTIFEATTLEGIGLHTGKPARMTFKPAPAGHGIYFIRSDMPGSPAVRATSRNVKATEMATVLGGELFAVSTVEHCMAAIGALRIDNLLIELSGPEIPIGDGSALPFFTVLKNAGVIEQPVYRKYLKVDKAIYFSGAGDKHAFVLPYNGFKISCTIEFPHPSIGRQSIDLDITPYTFETQLAGARTFGFLRDVEALQKKGLALGGSLDNAVVLNETGVMNPDGLRFSNEFVRHKALDAIGDIMLLGYPMIGHFNLYKAGHDVMHGFTKAIMDQPSSYSFVELESEPLAQTSVENLYGKHQVS